jgi:hypothetical protein
VAFTSSAYGGVVADDGLTRRSSVRRCGWAASRTPDSA